MTPEAENERLKAINEILVDRNAKLQQGMLEACHRVSVLAGRCYHCEHNHTVRVDPSKAETETLTRKNRDHA